MIHKEAEILQWAQDRGLIGPEGRATPIAQAEKTREEADELVWAVAHQNREEIIDSIGDCYVTLVIQAHMQNLTMAECIDHAYEVISKRTGVMRNGVFVKSEPTKRCVGCGNPAVYANLCGSCAEAME